MPRYVDVDKYLNDDFCGSHDICTKLEDCFLCWSENATEDVAPIIHSYWRKFHGYSKCNNCGQRSTIQTNYCPNCGAKMSK